MRGAWAIPFYIHTPPVEEFEKIVPQEKCVFSNTPPSCWIFRPDLPQRE